MSPRPDHVFVVHGDDEAAEGFADMLKTRYSYTATAPYSGSIFDMATGKWEYIAEPVIIPEKSAGRIKANAAYDSLNNAAEKLIDMIKHNDGMTNKDMKTLTNKILDLINKFE